MTKQEAYQTANQLGAGFVANLILIRHRNAARKLKGLVVLLQARHSVTVASYSCDDLLIDGVRRGWELLESPALIVKGTWR